MSGSDLNLDAIESLLLATPLRMLGLMRIKNESQWIRQSIESQLPICDRILILDDHSTDDTRDIVRSFGDRCVLMESEFTNMSEGRDKRFLLRHATVASPEWALWIDGDEVLEVRAPAILDAELRNPEVSWYWFRVLYFWDSLDKFRTDGVYGYITRSSLFRVRDQDAAALYFPVGGGSADLHNGGNCPRGLRGHGAPSAVRIKHYGYLTQEERQRKYEFYNRIDPNNESEDCYRHIIEIPGARHAPGPTVLEQWNER